MIVAKARRSSISAIASGTRTPKHKRNRTAIQKRLEDPDYDHNAQGEEHKDKLRPEKIGKMKIWDDRKGKASTYYCSLCKLPESTSHKKPKGKKAKSTKTSYLALKNDEMKTMLFWLKDSSKLQLLDDMAEEKHIRHVEFHDHFIELTKGMLDLEKCVVTSCRADCIQDFFERYSEIPMGPNVDEWQKDFKDDGVSIYVGSQSRPGKKKTSVEHFMCPSKKERDEWLAKLRKPGDDMAAETTATT